MPDCLGSLELVWPRSPRDKSDSVTPTLCVSVDCWRKNATKTLFFRIGRRSRSTICHLTEDGYATLEDTQTAHLLQPLGLLIVRNRNVCLTYASLYG